jgi:hypothetical protein
MENNNIDFRNQNQEEKPAYVEYTYQSKPSYYKNTRQKVGDFLLGFFGIIFLNFIFGIIFYPLSVFSNFGWQSVFISITILVLAVVIPFKIGRRFIALGVVSVALVPVLIFGSCLLMFATMYR